MNFIYRYQKDSENYKIKFLIKHIILSKNNNIKHEFYIMHLNMHINHHAG